MKKLLLGIGTVTMILIQVSAFSQEDKKAAQARKELSKANKNLTKAKIDSAADFNEFKLDAEAKIAENKGKIKDLRLADAELAPDLKSRYDKKIASLQESNNKLEKKIAKSVDTETTKWSEFKREFNKDMNELTDAIKNIGKKNHDK